MILVQQETYKFNLWRYKYGCKSGEHKFVLFDVKIRNDDGTYEWLSPTDVHLFAIERGIPMVPILYVGQFDLAAAKELTKGDSVLAPEQKVREGVVVKAEIGYTQGNGKKAMKIISEKYLSKDQTDFH